MLSMKRLPFNHMYLYGAAAFTFGLVVVIAILSQVAPLNRSNGEVLGASTSEEVQKEEVAAEKSTAETANEAVTTPNSYTSPSTNQTWTAQASVAPPVSGTNQSPAPNAPTTSVKPEETVQPPAEAVPVTEQPTPINEPENPPLIEVVLPLAEVKVQGL
jgi:hypothetical protein